MNLETQYLGLKLNNPVVVGASPLCDNIDTARQLEEAGAAAIVMHSLFEEQIELEQKNLLHSVEGVAESSAEATSYFPNYDEYYLTPDTYVSKVERLKAALSIPVIASLNGRTKGDWIRYAKLLENAGADAIELNTYQVATDPNIPAAAVEQGILEIVRAVKDGVKIPVSVKLSPYHAAPANFAAELEKSGADGLVLFNRFYQPDFDINELEIEPKLLLSNSGELLPRLRWLAILSPNAKTSLAASGGAHTSEDIIKAILAGAHTVQLVSVLLQQGAGVIKKLLAGITDWMNAQEIAELAKVRGALNLKNCADTSAHERANYIKILQSWKGL